MYLCDLWWEKIVVRIIENGQLDLNSWLLDHSQEDGHDTFRIHNEDLPIYKL